MTTDGIIMLILSGVLSTLFGVLLNIIVKGQKKADERYQQRVDNEVLQNRYYEDGCGLALKTAKTLHDQGTINGDLDQEYEDCKKSRDEYYDYRAAAHARMNMK